MKILVLANDESWRELTENNNNVEWLRAADINSFVENEGVDAYFNLTTQIINYTAFAKPVFIDGVSLTLKEIESKENIYRINGWNGFLKRSSWEIAGNMSESANAILEVLGKKVIVVPDEPGFVSGRIIAMIINEAYFANAESVSTKDEIDIAMKLGTNYPYGPFEWAEKIGLKNIYELLVTLSKTDERYEPADLLATEATKK